GIAPVRGAITHPVTPAGLLDDAVRRPARDAGGAPPLAQLMLVESVREVAEREPGRGIGPGDLPAGTVVPEGARGDRVAHAARGRPTVVARDDQAERAVRGRPDVVGKVIASVRRRVRAHRRVPTG